MLLRNGKTVLRLGSHHLKTCYPVNFYLLCPYVFMKIIYLCGLQVELSQVKNVIYWLTRLRSPEIDWLQAWLALELKQ